MAASVWVYPEKVHEPLGAERYQASWEEVKVSAERRNRMIQMNASRKHARETHAGDFDKCMVKDCEMSRYVEIDPDGDIDHLVKNFRGADAKQKALDYARTVLTSGKTAYGQVTVTRQVVDWFVEEDRVAEWQDTEDKEQVD